MAKPVARIQALFAAITVGALAVVVRAAQLQLVHGGEYAREATAQRTIRKPLDALRGNIYDRSGNPLAVSLETYHLGIAPAEVTNRDSVLQLVRTDLGLSTEDLRRRFKSGKYYYEYGPFTASQVARIRRKVGVYLEGMHRRSYPSGAVARPIIGALQPNAPRGESGLERFLDSLLAGVPGEATYLKDGRGRLYESPGRLVRLPVAGDDVTLTIDSELQSIAETALEEAFEEYHPDRGDIVFLDPRTGELLAAASRGIDSTGKTVRTASFFLNAFEPGSTAKPFTAAALLALKRVSATETVSPEAGKWVFPISATRTRTITDDHPQHAPITLAHAIQVSSNIGMAKFAQKLTREEHYDALHAFGFGSPTGIEFPVESPGVLQRPETWQPGQQGASMAMGYALQVTPIQLATAYGAIANDGVMMAPALIKEIRTSDGQVLYRHHPTAIRRVVPTEVAVQLRAFLANAASDSGTGKLAQVRYGVVGKTGTAKLTRTKLVRTKQGKMIRHSYYTNEHAASFAGIFPAKNPRLVVIVRIENPRGQYYGGFVAAPLVARMLRQALAARGSAINQVGLVDTLVRAANNPTPPKEEREDEERDERQAIRFPLPSSAGSISRPTEVPEVAGLSVRQAALALHRRGFRVRLEGSGRVVRSQPEAGDSLETGKTVTLYAETKPRS